MADNSLCEQCLHKCYTDENCSSRAPAKRAMNINELFNYFKSRFFDGTFKKDRFDIIVEGKIDENFWERLGKRDEQNNLEIQIKTISLQEPDDTSGTKSTSSPNDCSRFISSNKSAIECFFCKENQNLLHPAIKEKLSIDYRVIGMVDWDFQHSGISNNSKYDPDINIKYDPQHFFPLFRTETRDLEILLCKLGGLRFFLKKYIETDPHASKEDTEQKTEQKIDKIIHDLLSQATIPGYARILDANNGRKIKFRCLKTKEGIPNCVKKEKGINPFCEYIRKDKLFECSDLIVLLKNDNEGKNKRFKLFLTQLEKQSPFRDQENNGDPWSQCHGHNTIQILKCMFGCGRIQCKNYPTRHTIREEYFSDKILKEFINNKCYGRSEMIKQMIDWEKKYHPSHFETSSKGRLFIKKVYMEFNQKAEKRTSGSSLITCRSIILPSYPD